MAEQWAGDRTPPVRDAPEPRHLPAEMISESEIRRPEKPWPVWVTLTYPDQPPREVHGFAEAWTNIAVLVHHPEHVVYYNGQVTRWYPVFNVRRRDLNEEKPECGHGGKWKPVRKK